MDLIHFQGLNCFHDCVVSIANHFGISISGAFSTLWSETDFRYDSYREAYLSKRIITNLETLGAKVECFDCFSESDVIGHLSSFYDGELFIVGMDAFYIPWNQFYHTLHGPHYFIVRNAKTDNLTCFDPTYNTQNELIARHSVIAYTFDICHVKKSAKNPLPIEAADEAREIIRTHPGTRMSLLSYIGDCANYESEGVVSLAKYIDTMICNRYLYRFFLEHRPPYHAYRLFQNNSYFNEWAAVKNGLYKASVIRSKDSVIDEIRNHFNRLIDLETAMAEQIIEAERIRNT